MATINQLWAAQIAEAAAAIEAARPELPSGTIQNMAMQRYTGKIDNDNWQRIPEEIRNVAQEGVNYYTKVASGQFDDQGGMPDNAIWGENSPEILAQYGKTQQSSPSSIPGRLIDEGTATQMATFLKNSGYRDSKSAYQVLKSFNYDDTTIRRVMTAFGEEKTGETPTTTIKSGNNTGTGQSQEVRVSAAVAASQDYEKSHPIPTTPTKTIKSGNNTGTGQSQEVRVSAAAAASQDYEESHPIPTTPTVATEYKTGTSPGYSDDASVRAAYQARLEGRVGNDGKIYAYKLSDGSLSDLPEGSIAIQPYYNPYTKAQLDALPAATREQLLNTPGAAGDIIRQTYYGSETGDSTTASSTKSTSIGATTTAKQTTQSSITSAMDQQLINAARGMNDVQKSFLFSQNPGLEEKYNATIASESSAKASSVSNITTAPTSVKTKTATTNTEIKLDNETVKNVMNRLDGCMKELESTIKSIEKEDLSLINNSWVADEAKGYTSKVASSNSDARSVNDAMALLYDTYNQAFNEAYRTSSSVSSIIGNI